MSTITGHEADSEPYGLQTVAAVALAQAEPAVQADGLPEGRRFWAMAAVIVSVALATLDTAIANTALPTIGASLDITAAASVWVITSYQLTMVAALLPFASLGDIIGHRRVYIGGLALFTLASLLCALSSNLPELAAARAIQGVGAAAIMSVNSALVRFIFPANRLGRGIGLMAMTVALGFALGPTVAAGILAVAHSWTWLFAINVPFGIAALLLAVPMLPQTPRSSARFDYFAALLNAAAFSLAIFALGKMAHGASLSEVFGELGCSAILWIMLFQWQAGQASPMFPTDLFKLPVFALSSLTAVCAFAAQGLAFVSLPFLFQVELGHSAVETGLLFTPWPVTVAVMGIVAGRLSDRFTAAILGGLGLAILAAGLLLMAVLPPAPGNFDIGWRLVVCGIGFGLFQAPNLRALMMSVPAARSGGASGIVASSRLTGQATGAALVALCFGISAANGPALALTLGAVFAAGGCVASFLRLVPRPAAV